MNTAVGDEGGYAPNTAPTRKHWLLSLKRLKRLVTSWVKTSPAMDCAASEFYKDGKYVLAGEGNKAFTSEEFTHFWKN